MALQQLSPIGLSQAQPPSARRADPRREASAGARLPYARHLDDQTLETRDGMLIRVIHLAGLPFETAESEELNYRKAMREGMLRAIATSRFALYHHIVRRQVSPSLEADFSDPFSRALDAAWRARLETKRLYVNDLFLTLVRRPLQGQAGVFDGLVRAFRGGML
jgi:type IV secretion system protein VirB4